MRDGRGLEIRVSRRALYATPGSRLPTMRLETAPQPRDQKGFSAGNAGRSIARFTEGSQAGLVRYRLGSREKEKRMKSIPLALVLILALAGCAQFQQQAALSTGIAPGEVEWARKSGRNTVSGNASLKSGGTTYPCAGQSANLIPDTAYARARMTAIFGNATRGTRAATPGPGKVGGEALVYVSTLRTARCDASGSFSFPGVPDGVWYVTANVKWQDGTQGSSMMQRVDVQGGRLTKVILP